MHIGAFLDNLVFRYSMTDILVFSSQKLVRTRLTLLSASLLTALRTSIQGIHTAHP